MASGRPTSIASHVLLYLPFLPSPLDSTTHGICSAGSPLPWCLSSPQFMHLRELAGRSSHLQGSLPRRCDQDHLPRSVRFGCCAEGLCDRRRPRLRQPVAALTSAPRPKTRSFLFFSMSRSSPTASFSFCLPPSPGRGRISAPFPRPESVTRDNGKMDVQSGTPNVERGHRRRRLCPARLLVWVHCVSRRASVPRGLAAQELIPKRLAPLGTNLVDDCARYSSPSWPGRNTSLDRQDRPSPHG